ncbi:MAG: hypothetical protein KC931_22735, partial [Candidatus Omnitrophica bacterium]|nr:hypothetical protein [Candidatus Omnitrophota bacterium]
LAFLLQYLLISRLDDWSGSYSFGQRRLVSGLFFIGLGWAHLFNKASRAPGAVLSALAILLTVWNYNLFRAWVQGFMDWNIIDYGQLYSILTRSPDTLFWRVTHGALAPDLLRGELELAHRDGVRILVWTSPLWACLIGFAGMKKLRVAMSHEQRTRRTQSASWFLLAFPLLLSGAFVLSHLNTRLVRHLDFRPEPVEMLNELFICSERIGRNEIFLAESSRYVIEPSQQVVLKAIPPIRAKRMGFVVESRKEDGSPLEVNPSVSIDDGAGSQQKIECETIPSSMREPGLIWEENGAESRIWYCFQGNFSAREVHAIEYRNLQPQPVKLVSLWFD